MSNFLNAARYTDKSHPEPHQIAAWSMAWEWLNREQQKEFLETFRSATASESATPGNNSWAGIIAIAKNMGVKYPELVAAQWAHESNWGQRTTGKNNYFGLKGKGTKVETTEFENGEKVAIVDEFVNFRSLEDCVKYLIQRWYFDFMVGNKIYHGVDRAKNRNQAAKLLVEEGYATDPRYAENLIKIMNEMDVKGKPAPEKPKPLKVEETKKPAVQDELVLSVPWYSQLDSSTDQGRRMCFSSSCAMLVAHLRPGKLSGPNGDDQYLAVVNKYGDTTDPGAQIKALSSYGIKARFVKNADFAIIESQIKSGIPVPCGYLHRGPVSSPAGGGHWLIVVGYNKMHVVVHDPFGESDLLTGGTINAIARYAKYSKKNWGRRWMVEGPKTGWAILAEK